MVYLLALGAALANALTSVLQRMGLEDAPDDATLKLSLLTHALRRGVWLAGFGFMVASFLLQAVALHFGRLTQVQPLLTTELLFLVVLLAVWFRFDVGVREWLAALAAALGLAAFCTAHSPGRDQGPDGRNWIVVGVACAVLAGVSVALALRGPRWWRAAMSGRRRHRLRLHRGPHQGRHRLHRFGLGVDVLPLADLRASGHRRGGPFLAQNAFHAGPIAASQSTLIMVDPLVSILIGIVLFGDQLRTHGAWARSRRSRSSCCSPASASCATRRSCRREGGRRAPRRAALDPVPLEAPRRGRRKERGAARQGPACGTRLRAQARPGRPARAPWRWARPPRRWCLKRRAEGSTPAWRAAAIHSTATAPRSPPGWGRG